MDDCRHKVTTAEANRAMLICQICGDVARGLNFDVLTCMSCKAFFRRNALRVSGTRRCTRTNACLITQETRSNCPACRLKKCFAVGMNPLLIRSLQLNKDHLYRSQSAISMQKKLHQFPSPRSLDLLQSEDRSMLTHEQWTLLSNVIQAYDHGDLVGRVRGILDEKSCLPVKLRSKALDTLNLISEPIKSLLPLIRMSPHFHYLSTDAQELLESNNLFFTGALNGYLVARELDAFRNPTYMTACSALYGEDYMMKCAKDSLRLEPNGNLVKMILFVLIFSSNCSIVLFTPVSHTLNYCATKSAALELLNMQDIYVAMLWKYMVYLYGYDRAAVRFSLMVKSVLDMFSRVQELPMDSTSAVTPCQSLPNVDELCIA